MNKEQKKLVIAKNLVATYLIWCCIWRTNAITFWAPWFSFNTLSVPGTTPVRATGIRAWPTKALTNGAEKKAQKSTTLQGTEHTRLDKKEWKTKKWVEVTQQSNGSARDLARDTQKQPFHGRETQGQQRGTVNKVRKSGWNSSQWGDELIGWRQIRYLRSTK